MDEQKKNTAKWIQHQYLTWQLKTGSTRTLKEFHEFLIDNRGNLTISRPALSQWMNAERLPDSTGVAILSEKFGPEIYDLTGRVRPDADLAFITSSWHKISGGCKRQIRKIVDDDLARSS